MIECQSCGRKYRPGTLFCSECGAYLVTGGTLQTDPLPEEDLPASEASPWASVPVEEPSVTSPIPPPRAPRRPETPRGVEELDATPLIPLRVRIISTGREIQLPSGAEVQIGRLDAAHGIFPDLDLTSDVRLKDGVSRRHCKIHRRGSIYLVEDVGSSNGTFLNGLRLSPYLLYELKDGDELQLGNVKLKVVIQE